MDPFSMVLGIVFLGCATGVVTTFIDKAFGGKQKAAQLEAKAALDRVRLLEAQLLEAHRHNEQLQKQLEWHTKMLETQDRLVKQLADGSSAAQSRAERSAISTS